ncbi:TetR family transcriptional regulator C-terminal domain-containing protein [Paracoccus jiaweipingae]|uniref:TetR family transcriptional regulator C-terminal domain-containing protein n=1 Tax=unclassified Paracoccus (in: a-proteobacteria) TaxID=2688777 RepID=UPI003794B7D8
MPPSSDKRGKTRIQREKTEIILNAALDIFARDGFRGASINKISEHAGMSTPSLLYYFGSKEKIHKELMSRTLLLWIGPLNMMRDNDDPIAEICDYVRRKLEISQNFPRESRLFANEVLMGVPRAQKQVFDPLRSVFDSKIALVEQWINDGRIAPVDPYHMFYSIWATTQHYADFKIQIEELSPHKAKNLFPEAEAYLTQMYRRMLTPSG